MGRETLTDGTAQGQTAAQEPAPAVSPEADGGVQDGGPLTEFQPPAAPEGRPAAAAPAPLWLDRLFDILPCAAPLVLLLALAALAWPGFVSGNLYCPAEAAHVHTYWGTAASGMWLAPSGAGHAGWPAFYWLLGGLDVALAHCAAGLGHWLFPLAAAGCAFLLLLAVWCLGLAAGVGRREALAASLVLFCTPVFAPLSGFTGPQGLAAALTLLSLALLCRGWRRDGAVLALPLGFVLAALAGLAGGPGHALAPVLVCLVFVLWRSGGLLRSRRWDGLAGFFLFLATLGLWLVAVILWQQPEGYLRRLWLEQAAVWPPAAGWWRGFLLLGLGLVPWLFLPLGVSWLRVLRGAPRGLLQSRKDAAGLAFLWIALLVLLALSPFFASPLGASLCVAGVAAPLLGRALLRLPPLGRKFFHLLTALCLLCVGAVLLAAYFGPALDMAERLFGLALTAGQRQSVQGLTALPLLGGLCLAAALAVLCLARPRSRAGAGAGLLVYLLLALLLAQPAALLLAPQLAALPEARVQYLESIPPLSAPSGAPVPAGEAPASPAAPPAGSDAEEAPSADEAAPRGDGPAA